jgi:hypothetical protein
LQKILPLPISYRSRKYGYIYWLKKNDEAVREFFGKVQSVRVLLYGHPLGLKRIDWKHRRISLGWKQTRSLAKDLTEFHLSFNSDGTVSVKCL